MTSETEEQQEQQQQQQPTAKKSRTVSAIDFYIVTFTLAVLISIACEIDFPRNNAIAYVHLKRDTRDRSNQ